MQRRHLLRILPLCVLACAQGASIDPHTYQAVACGGNYGPCDFTPFERTPTEHDLAGLSSDLFRDFFIAHGINVGAGIFQWIAVGSNDHDFVFGTVLGSNMIQTQFVYRHGVLTCCTTDYPFLLTGINDNNLLVGATAPPTVGFLSSAIIMDPDKDNFLDSLNIIPDPRTGRQFGKDARPNYYFAGIDNHNDILLRMLCFPNCESYVLRPEAHDRLLSDAVAAADAPVPEPAAFWLVLVGIAAIYGLRFPDRASSRTGSTDLQRRTILFFISLVYFSD